MNANTHPGTTLRTYDQQPHHDEPDHSIEDLLADVLVSSQRRIETSKWLISLTQTSIAYGQVAVEKSSAILHKSKQALEPAK